METIKNIEDLARILREQPEWAETLRGILLGQELLELPEKFAQFVELTSKNFQLVHQRLERLEADVAELKTDMVEVKADLATLKEGQARLETNQTRMSGQLSSLIGSDYEKEVARVAHRRVKQYLNVNRAVVIWATSLSDKLELTRLVDQAINDGAISEDEGEELELADLILRGQSDNGSPAHVLAEVSITVKAEDINRAAHRAGILRRSASGTTYPAVIGESISDTALDLAAQRQVTFLPVRRRQEQPL